MIRPMHSGNAWDFLTLQEIPPEFPVKQKVPHGCAARGEEISCFVTPSAREEFTSELFIL